MNALENVTHAGKWTASLNRVAAVRRTDTHGRVGYTTVLDTTLTEVHCRPLVRSSLKHHWPGYTCDCDTYFWFCYVLQTHCGQEFTLDLDISDPGTPLTETHHVVLLKTGVLLPGKHFWLRHVVEHYWKRSPDQPGCLEYISLNSLRSADIDTPLTGIHYWMRYCVTWDIPLTEGTHCWLNTSPTGIWYQLAHTTDC